jgi:hypothetical protein
VHRVACTTRRAAFARTARISGGNLASTLSAPMRVISVSRPGSFGRVERVEQAQQIVGLEARPALHADRVLDAAQELDMRAAG